MAISLPYMEIGADTDRSDGTSRKEKKKESALCAMYVLLIVFCCIVA